MSFLVILISLAVNYLWLRDHDRFDDGWFFRFRHRMEQTSSELSAKLPVSWPINLLLIYGIPLTTLILLLLFIAGKAYGIPTMLVHILVLLVAFDRTQPGQLARQFLTRWRQNDVEGCEELVRLEFAVPVDTAFESPAQLGSYFSKQLTYRWFERLFVMFFWYMVGGPVATLICYITYQLRDSHGQDQAVKEVAIIDWAIALLEWLPLRLLALTFSLAGNFVTCFERMKQSFWSFSKDFAAADMLAAYAGCALSGLITEYSQDIDDTEEATAASEALAVTAAPLNEEQRQVAAELAALRGLLERSQAIWLAVLALITIFAIP